MDYEGDNMWSITLNPVNGGGEMRVVSMDGEQEQMQVAGFENAHHDFTVMPGGKVAALVWSDPGIEPESDLVIRSPDGTFDTAFKIGKNLFRADMDMYHANGIHYLPFDDSFTIADRNPNLFVKVSAAGQLQWQLGGSCDQAPAGDQCVPQDWQVNHGHQLLEDGHVPGVHQWLLRESSRARIPTGHDRERVRGHGARGLHGQWHQHGRSGTCSACRAAILS